MKRQILVLAGAFFATSLFAQAFSGGSGTAEDPYLISSVADLKELSSMVDTPGEGDTQQTYGKCFKLTQDITEPLKYMIGLEGFFRGDFNGDGHCITVDISMPTDDYVGLFGTVKTGAVHDLAVKGTVEGRRYVGAIVANPTNGARLYNLVNYATVTSSYTSLAYVGGIVGGIVSHTDGSLSGAIVNNCANYGTVVCDGSAVGGVIGYSGQAVGNTISDIANYGDVVNKGSARVGGVIGNPLYNDVVHRVVNFGTVSSEKISGCLGNSNPTDLGEIFYDKQYAYNIYGVPAQEKNTSEMTATGMQNDLGDTWTYADALLPRPVMGGFEDSDIAVLYAAPVMLADGDNLRNVTRDFSLSLGNSSYGSVSWTAKNGLVEIQPDGKVVLKSSGDEVLTSSLNGATRNIAITVNLSDGISGIAVGSKTSGGWYNLNGQRVDSRTKGILIHNGKKVVVR